MEVVVSRHSRQWLALNIQLIPRDFSFYVSQGQYLDQENLLFITILRQVTWCIADHDISHQLTVSSRLSPVCNHCVSRPKPLTEASCLFILCFNLRQSVVTWGMLL